MVDALLAGTLPHWYERTIREPQGPKVAKANNGQYTKALLERNLFLHIEWDWEKLNAMKFKPDEMFKRVVDASVVGGAVGGAVGGQLKDGQEPPREEDLREPEEILKEWIVEEAPPPPQEDPFAPGQPPSTEVEDEADEEGEDDEVDEEDEARKSERARPVTVPAGLVGVDDVETDGDSKSSEDNSGGGEDDSMSVSIDGVEVVPSSSSRRSTSRKNKNSSKGWPEWQTPPDPEPEAAAGTSVNPGDIDWDDLPADHPLRSGTVAPGPNQLPMHEDKRAGGVYKEDDYSADDPALKERPAKDRPLGELPPSELGDPSRFTATSTNRSEGGGGRGTRTTTNSNKNSELPPGVAGPRLHPEGEHELPDGWRTYVSKEPQPERNGRRYYHHIASGVSQWRRPRCGKKCRARNLSQKMREPLEEKGGKGAAAAGVVGTENGDGTAVKAEVDSDGTVTVMKGDDYEIPPRRVPPVPEPPARQASSPPGPGAAAKSGSSTSSGPRADDSSAREPEPMQKTSFDMFTDESAPIEEQRRRETPQPAKEQEKTAEKKKKTEGRPAKEAKKKAVEEEEKEEKGGGNKRKKAKKGAESAWRFLKDAINRKTFPPEHLEGVFGTLKPDDDPDVERDEDPVLTVNAAPAGPPNEKTTLGSIVLKAWIAIRKNMQLRSTDTIQDKIISGLSRRSWRFAECCSSSCRFAAQQDSTRGNLNHAEVAPVMIVWCKRKQTCCWRLRRLYGVTNY